MQDNLNQPSAKPRSIIKLLHHISYHFREKYVLDFGCDAYRKTVIKHIIYNEQSHSVALFKDFLILDDSSEFLKRYYTLKESDKRLPKFYEYYETYSKIFPNYTTIQEGKYLYRNIQKKQKMIDLQEQMEVYNNLKNKDDSKEGENSNEVFSTDVYDSIINDRNNEDLEEIFNSNEKDDDFIDKLEEIVFDIEKNDTRSIGHLHNKSNSMSNGIAKGNSNNIPMQLTSNLFSTKHKLLISSLLGRNKYISTRNNLSNNNPNDTYNKILFNINNRILTNNNSISNSSHKFIPSSQIPWTERDSFSSRNHIINSINHTSHTQTQTHTHTHINTNTNTNCNNQEGSIWYTTNRTKLFPEYPKTIVTNNYPFNKMNKERDEITGSRIPFTQRDCCRNKSNELRNPYISKKTNKDIKIVQANNDNQRNIRHQMTIKTPKKYTNNYVYIINQNPKFTTHVTYFNNNYNTSSLSPFHTIKKKNPSTNKGIISNSGSYKIESKRCSVDNVITSYIGSSKGKTRNSKQTILNNNNMMILKTTRESNCKDLNLLRASSQPAIQTSQADNLSETKYNWKRNTQQIRDSLKNSTNSSSNNQQGNKGERVIQRNNIIHCINTNINTNGNNNTNSNVNKLLSNKQIVKGIQIKNFSKVFTLNFSQATSERLKNKD